MLIIDKLAYTSKIREESPDLKVAFSLSTLVVCIGTNSIVMSIAILLIIGYLTVKYSQISFCRYMKMLSLPIGFLTLSLLGIFFDFSLKAYDFFNIDLGSFYIAVSKGNFINGIKLFSVSLGSVSALYSLALSTPMIDILGVMKRWNLPSILVEITLLVYRFIFILLDMAENITISQNSRLGDISFKRRLNSISMTLSIVLIRALNKANNLYLAMESRCYDGNIRVLWERKKAERKMKVAFCIYLVLLIFLGVFIRYKAIY